MNHSWVRVNSQSRVEATTKCTLTKCTNSTTNLDHASKSMPRNTVMSKHSRVISKAKARNGARGHNNQVHKSEGFMSPGKLPIHSKLLFPKTSFAQMVSMVYIECNQISNHSESIIYPQMFQGIQPLHGTNLDGHTTQTSVRTALLLVSIWAECWF